MKDLPRGKAPAPRSSRRASVKEAVVFEYFDPSAKIVTVVGDFNQWNPLARPFKRNTGGLWKVTVRLAPGTYQYKFVVNGQRWEDDPLNVHRVPNEHGTFNSIRKVGASPEDSLGPT